MMMMEAMWRCKTRRNEKEKEVHIPAAQYQVLPIS